VPLAAGVATGCNILAAEVLRVAEPKDVGDIVGVSVK